MSELVAVNALRCMPNAHHYSEELLRALGDLEFEIGEFGDGTYYSALSARSANFLMDNISIAIRLWSERKSGGIRGYVYRGLRNRLIITLSNWQFYIFADLINSLFLLFENFDNRYRIVYCTAEVREELLNIAELFVSFMGGESSLDAIAGTLTEYADLPIDKLIYTREYDNPLVPQDADLPLEYKVETYKREDGMYYTRLSEESRQLVMQKLSTFVSIASLSRKSPVGNYFPKKDRSLSLNIVGREYSCASHRSRMNENTFIFGIVEGIYGLVNYVFDLCTTDNPAKYYVTPNTWEEIRLLVKLCFEHKFFRSLKIKQNKADLSDLLDLVDANLLTFHTSGARTKPAKHEIYL